MIIKLINIVYKVGQRRTGNIPVKEPHTSDNLKKKKIFEIAFNLLRDFPHPNPASLGKQSDELQ